MSSIKFDRMLDNDKMILQFMNAGGYILNPDGSIWSTQKCKLSKLKYSISSSGYYYVDLTLNKTAKHFAVHRIIWIMNFGLIPYGLEINHKDGNKLNNDLRNLELCTTRENTLHAFRTNPMYTKLTKKQVEQIRSEYRPKVITQSMLAKKYNISRSFVGNIVRNEWYRKETL